MSAAVMTAARGTKPRPIAGLHEVLRRIESEYREMPALSLTAPQAQRLWGLDSTTCSFVLTTLIERGVLKQTAHGTYVRVEGEGGRWVTPLT
jgi:hypothetical protein